MLPTTRPDLVDSIRRDLENLSRPHPLRVGIDGVSASGKSSLTREVKRTLESEGHRVIHVEMDSFHHPAERRYRQGTDSVRGYIDDSFDYAKVAQDVLQPAGPDGKRVLRIPRKNIHADPMLQGEEVIALCERSIVIVEGVFSLHADLREHYELRVYVDCCPNESMRRGEVRDAGRLGGQRDVREKYRKRYLPGQQLFADEQQLRRNVHTWVDNTRPEAPIVTKEAL